LGKQIDVENDNSLNFSLSLDDDSGEIGFRSMNMGAFHGIAEQDGLLSAETAIEYCWQIVKASLER